MRKSCSGLQNGWAWKGSLRVTWTNLLLKQRHLEWLSNWFLTISTDGDSIIILGNQCQCLVILTVEKCFQMFQSGVFKWNLLCFHLCPLLLVTGKSLNETSSHSSLKVFIYIDKISTQSSLAQRRLFWPWLHFSCCISALTMVKISPWVFAHADKDTADL